MVLKIHDIAHFIRRSLGLQEPEKTDEGVPLEKQEIPEERKTVEEKKAPAPEKGKARQRKRRQPGRKEELRGVKPVDLI